MALRDLDGALGQAMIYAVQGGKGLRAFLAIESAALFGIERTAAAPAGAAIEALHAYSLVHDDLPCMDDDDLRRGKPTVHRQWDEATAVLTGDALQALAFNLVLKTVCPAEARVTLALGLSEAAGVRGMVGGQAMDIAAESAALPLDLDQITALQAGKTGALITWSAEAGAIMAQQDPAPLRRYGDCLGLAFQIADDVLDVEGDADAMGKAVGKDDARGKATFVGHLGLDGAKRRAEALVQEACDSLSLYGDAAGNLREAARFVISRRN
ncbi:polyprenyl synthetase family protein [Pseudoponticoccus marisrubri]|uniref:Geranylgeranyl diphosphate synthase n=1 Tax=Pseudoponticoccus marisrubri TaxID=1685382 RepID=A0A0W7WQL9_9RHOB|nr:polyprenyl synthetase family protein [Pseudoponticoccus marisrubri]KUF12864.1 farnesyl-diphosphate synthase [Pseudoponticoccus marisrubri]